MKDRPGSPFFTLICFRSLLPGLLLGSALLHAGHAQVATNLDALPGTNNTDSHKTVRKSSSKPSPDTYKTSPRTTQTEAAQRIEEPPSPIPAPSSTGAGYTTVPGVPETAPPAPIIAPPFVPIERHPPVLPQEVIPVQDAGTHAEALNNQDLRILFSHEDARLDKATIDSVNSLGKTLAQYPEKRLLLKSYATLRDDDMSMQRRLSLARALAVRSILIRSGIATTRIYPIAYGRPNTGPIPASNTHGNYLDIVIEENPVISAASFSTKSDDVPANTSTTNMP